MNAKFTSRDGWIIKSTNDIQRFEMEDLFCIDQSYKPRYGSKPDVVHTCSHNGAEIPNIGQA